MSLNGVIFLTPFIFLGSVSAWQATSVSGFYRVEVELGQLENEQGIQSNGQYCDEITTCDPVVYTYMDVERPLAPWPDRTPAEQTMLTWRRNTNTYQVNQTMTKDICGGGLSNVNARVEVMDEDFFGKYDLIEQFECKFFPTIAETLNYVEDGVTTFKEWSPTEECTAKHQAKKIKLSFRWRAYAIDRAVCGVDTTAVKTSGGNKQATVLFGTVTQNSVQTPRSDYPAV